MRGRVLPLWRGWGRPGRCRASRDGLAAADFGGQRDLTVLGLVGLEGGDQAVDVGLGRPGGQAASSSWL